MEEMPGSVHPRLGCRFDRETRMLLPVGDDSDSHVVPVVNMGIVVLNILVFAAVNVLGNDVTAQNVFDGYGIVPGDLAWYQFLTSLFLHGGWMHIIGNMWFLWVFGDAVENRLGHVGYAVFYLVAGIGASVFYLLFTPKTLMPCIGASGAIFGVVASYAILFPRNEIRMLYWFWLFVGTFHVKAVWIVGFWVVEQVVTWHLMSEFGRVGGIAYAAHVGGALFGILLAVAVRTWWPEERIVDDWGPSFPITGGERWSPAAGPSAPPPTPPVVPLGFDDPPESEVSSMDDVSRAFANDDPERALELYRQHAACRPGAPMAAPAQIAIADALFKRADFDEALDAYRLYLDAYGAEAHAATAKFRAAVILSRRRGENAEAAKLLLEVIMEHPDPEVVELARGELARIRQKV
jgi:membrane associated rhomboid family serine protease